MPSVSITPPPPATPPPRYPAHLSKSRPLLHRRGTSHMYETLEDLLKEAGYKETRIFTPESERIKNTADRLQQGTGTVRGTVVKLLSTWMNKLDAEHVDPVHVPEHENVPPSRLRHTASAPHIRGRSRRTHHHPKLYANPNLNATSTSTATTASSTHPTQTAITPVWLASLFSPRTPPASPVRSPRTQPRLLSHPRAASGVTITNVVCRPVTPRAASSSSNKARKYRKPVPVLVCEPCDGKDSRNGPFDDEDDDDDDEDGEVDLARMLIPAKRQHSIRSLRDVLATHPYRAASPVQRTHSAMGSRERSTMYSRERTSQHTYTVQASLYNYVSSTRPKSPLSYSSAQNVPPPPQLHGVYQTPFPTRVQRSVLNANANISQCDAPTPAPPTHVAAPTAQRPLKNLNATNANANAPTHRGHSPRLHLYTSQLSTSPTAMAVVHEQELETPVNDREEAQFSSLRVKRRRSGLPVGWVA